MTESTRNSSYRFGTFELQPTERRLLAGGQPVVVGPRAFDLLVTLVERPGQLVTKEELLDSVWPKLVVEENNLQVQVSALRKILGREAIATIPGRGYRFTVTLTDSDAAGSSPTSSPRNNLPHPLTRFVGREVDLDECAGLLDENRLLTLTGIGGCGKTRLAIKLAERMLPSFPDGVWFVDLAPVGEAEHVALAVATALGVREEMDNPLEETLKRHLAGEMLLVLDNCEHVLGACAALVEPLLMGAPGLRALVTSREGLGVAGERTVTVRSLSFPSLESAQDLETLAGFEAVRLFTDRAKQVAPEFTLSPTNAPAVVEICRRLDGIPLALELAAARVRLLSTEQIRAKLDDRFHLLTGGSRTISRHQTLLATLQWSYEHLTPDEQRLLQRLSVFVDGCTLGAAAAVAGQGLDELEVLERLERLVDKSLVLVDRRATESRYKMLETVRQYAQDRLNDSGQSNAVREQHLAHFLSFAKIADADRFTEKVGQWLEKIGVELPNLLAAHAPRSLNGHNQS